MKLVESKEVDSRRHLFISYAIEDSDFANWLALKLASEGYEIWYDRLKLLGGESYPIDITNALKNQTFRVIAILSRNSINKPNPIKERTLALNIAREREIDFLIPLNLDGLKSTELDFMTSDIVYLPFDKSWYIGLSALLKKLEKIETPKNTEINRQRINNWLLSEEKPIEKKEIIWSNILPILELPKKIFQYKIIPEINIEEFQSKWVFWRENEDTIWAFGKPHFDSKEWLKEVKCVEIEKLINFDSNLKRLFIILIRKAIENYCTNKGLKFFGRSLYFPNKLIEKNKLYFSRYDGKKVFIKVVGIRTFRVASQGSYFTEKSRYHISPEFKFILNKLGKPCVKIRIRVFWTDLSGFPLESKKANRRRKKLCKNWWNYQWLSRTIAVLQWLGEEKDEITLLKSDSGDLKIATNPISFISDVGIDEKSLTRLKAENERQIIDDNEDDGDQELDELCS